AEEDDVAAGVRERMAGPEGGIRFGRPLGPSRAIPLPRLVENQIDPRTSILDATVSAEEHDLSAAWVIGERVEVELGRAAGSFGPTEAVPLPGVIETVVSIPAVEERASSRAVVRDCVAPTLLAG